MHYPSIALQGTLLSNELISRLTDNGFEGQGPTDFKVHKEQQLRDQIGSAFASLGFEWRHLLEAHKVYQDQAEPLQNTYQAWAVKVFTNLGYQLEKRQPEILHGSQFAISHYAPDCHNLPVHILPYDQSLDQSLPASSGYRGSAHAMVQDYLNQKDEHLYAILTNGKELRILRDAPHLSQVAYVSFQFNTMLGDSQTEEDEKGLYADFAIFYRLLHVSRLQVADDDMAHCLLEHYHQESLAAGARVRKALSGTIKEGLRALGQGFTLNPKNSALQTAMQAKAFTPQLPQEGMPQSFTHVDFYRYLLRVIYRLLFLVVTEERNLIFEEPSEKDDRDEREQHARRYYTYYSIRRIRALSDQITRVGQHRHDLWEGVKTTFSLFEDPKKAEILGLSALGGELFSPESLGPLRHTVLDNRFLIQFLKGLNYFKNEQGQLQRVNYADLDTEELGSIYEELLDDMPTYEADAQTGKITLRWQESTDRKRSGSHYTEDELVKPLISHSLEKQLEDIEQRAQQGEVEALKNQLLQLRVLDPACGSGHILIKVARRMALTLARIEEGTDNPSGPCLRACTRTVIQKCLYGVDKNSMAVELCKVALWLEAHRPGLPLNFLDHRIRQGDTLLGCQQVTDLLRPLPNEAFKKRKGDDITVLKGLRKQNKKGSDHRYQLHAFRDTHQSTHMITKAYTAFLQLEENDVTQVAEKQKAFQQLRAEATLQHMQTLAHLQLAPWFITKTTKTQGTVLTNVEYYPLLRNHEPLNADVESANDPALAQAEQLAQEHGFFHWFLEFPDLVPTTGEDQTPIFKGFDFIVGNPPFLGGLKLSTYLGDRYMNYLHGAYAPAKGTTDLAAYFFRRAYDLLGPKRFLSFISTNTIAQGDTREGGLSYLLDQGASISHAIRSQKWPGVAAVEVSILSLFKGKWTGQHILNGKEVEVINSYLGDSEPLPSPKRLQANANMSFIGSYILGDGFIMSPEEAQMWIDKDPKNKDVLFPYLNGKDLNSRPDQSPSRWVINFHDWPLNPEQDMEEATRKNPNNPKSALKGPPYAVDYPDLLKIVEEKVKPERQRWKLDKNGQPIIGDYQLNPVLARDWWRFARRRGKLYDTIQNLSAITQSYPSVGVVSIVTKHLSFSTIVTNYVYACRLCVIIGSPELMGVLHSSIFQHWAWKYSSTLRAADLLFSPTDCFENYPFPNSSPIIHKFALELESARKDVCQEQNIGLTELGNQIHGNEPGLENIRNLIRQLDYAILKAYGWNQDGSDGPAINLDHGFYALPHLPEKDNIRFTISPIAWEQVHKRLYALNQERAKEKPLPMAFS